MQSGKNKLMAADLARARVLYEMGYACAQIARELGVSERTIRYHAHREGWRRGAQEIAEEARAMFERARVRALGFSEGVSAEDAENRIAEIIALHRQETDSLQRLLVQLIGELHSARTREDCESLYRRARLLQLVVDVVGTLQALERLNWGIGETSSGGRIIIERVEAAELCGPSARGTA